ncbi:MAG: 6-phospho-beta-glucosidase [Arachnia propionica]|uniref:family 4 glycosyl hydrolase n=1 Tax=Arachnia propionica TaxID=1750 RepID=UPI0026F6F128|nr:6-phospho-beta-glucosidase [Arachnia propionica]
MRLTLLGGGGFRVPLLFRTLLADRSDRRVTELRLWDTDPTRVHTVNRILHAMAEGHPTAPDVIVADSLEEAVRGSDFVFSAIRVGGTSGRAAEEEIAHCCGVLGQETTGFGGLDYALRGIPTALEIARTVATVAPRAHLINFTNPAGIITEVSSRVLGDRVIGICDSPIGLARRVLGTLEGAGLAPVGSARDVIAGDDRLRMDYVGLNHLGWLQHLEVEGVDVLPRLLERPDLLESFEEGRLFGAAWLQWLGSIPNEYLHYYYFARETRLADEQLEATRGIFLARQQAEFYRQAADLDGPAAFALWEATRLRREETYMASNRLAAGGLTRDEEDLASGGYDRVALAVMKALAFDEATDLIVNFRNGSRLPMLPADTVIEAPCRIDASGVTPLPVSPLPDHAIGLVQSVKFAERTIIQASLNGSRDDAVAALALHPLIDGVGVARRLLDEATARFPELSELS